MSQSYVSWARQLLVEELGAVYRCADDLVDFYTLLVLTQGMMCTLEHVHDAWSIWRAKTMPEHKSIVPFEQLTEEVQGYDEPYCQAIRRAAARLEFVRSTTAHLRN